jgi:acetoacetyl-CoA synthetase
MKDTVPRLLWNPSAQLRSSCHLTSFMDWVGQKYKISFGDYHKLWEWSVEDESRFWESIWNYFSVISHSPYTNVLEDIQMPGQGWFKGGRLNYVEHVFRDREEKATAIFHCHELSEIEIISFKQLRDQVASFAAYLRSEGFRPGDRVVAYMPNIPEATIAFLACASIGVIWSSCSQDFGISSVVDRFKQISPKLILSANGYTYGGKPFTRMNEVQAILNEIPSIEKWILVDHIEMDNKINRDYETWDDVIDKFKGADLNFEALAFDHPIFILFSSGTTGVPKAITHGHGGMLLEHLKYLHFHNDVRSGEKFFWYSTTGWMMWNFTNAALLTGASIVLYDGSPAYPNLNRLWSLAAEVGITHFGTSAPYLTACMKNGIKPGMDHDLSTLRSIGSTGSPLPPEAFDYVYKFIKKDIWLCSMSGGTDVCTAFVGGNPLLPVYEGEIQCRTLGCSLFCVDEEGNKLENDEGEMVITKAMPCMPVKFWNDPDGKKYHTSYFEEYPGWWRHGDWIRITPRNSLIIYGRSDATLNRQGVRIGTAEIYGALNQLDEITDSLIVNLELSKGRHFMPLFVILQDNMKLDDQIIKNIKVHLRNVCSPRHVPDQIIQVFDIPYTISGKKMEAPVKKILLGKENSKSFNQDAMRNPESMNFFRKFAKQIEL